MADMIWLKKIYRIFRDIYWMIFQRRADKKWFREHVEKVNTEENPTYYVIRRINKVGLFSYVQTTLGQIVYALEHNMIPIVDMKNYPNTYLEEDEIGVKNAWELFFKQICDKDLDEVLANGKYILSEDTNIDLRFTPRLNGVYQKRAYWFWSEMYRKYVVFSEPVEEYCEKEYDSILKNRAEKTLGVLVRGTDYKYAKGHAIQPTVETVIDKVKDVLEKDKSFQYIYLATDEFKTEQEFQKAFPGKIIINKRTYFDGYDFSKTLIGDIVLERENDKYLRGLEYLSSLNLLSKCGGLCSGLSGGTFAAFYMNHGKYRYKYFWDLGNAK